MRILVPEIKNEGIPATWKPLHSKEKMVSKFRAK